MVELELSAICQHYESSSALNRTNFEIKLHLKVMQDSCVFTLVTTNNLFNPQQLIIYDLEKVHGLKGAPVVLFHEMNIIIEF